MRWETDRFKDGDMGGDKENITIVALVSKIFIAVVVAVALVCHVRCILHRRSTTGLIIVKPACEQRDPEQSAEKEISNVRTRNFKLKRVD